MNIKIVSNPYTREIDFFSFKEQSANWENIKDDSKNSRLREDTSGRNFLPFRIKEIIDTIISEYYTGEDKIHILFEGTQDEYKEVVKVCSDDDIKDKIEVSRTSRILENASTIIKEIKNNFETVQPIIEKIVKDDEDVHKDLNKVSDALKDIIPICVFGNYSSGKSSFINALIGSEVLPSGGDPVTAKIYKIERSDNDEAAKIRFEYKGEPFEILFEGTDYHLLTGNAESDIIQDIFNSINESKTRNMTAYVGIALEYLNSYEKKDPENIVISNVIELEIPFSKNGILGQSYKHFVIFDTPGSNSQSNVEHSAVLTQALDGFSNGIPVWVTTYESIDSTDNASLCEKILNIDALDKRFTMIAVNKADGSDLDDCEFSEEKEQEILEYSSVEKMYASGIYFVSSIIGLGAKNEGLLIDKHYRKIYRSQHEMYSDPDDVDYAMLYRYNIMPKQIKKNVNEYCAKCSNLIYANSGLYCIEKEMENFASRYASYNKCQMVYTFLRTVIEKTNKQIDRRTESCKKQRDKIREELETEKAKLIDEISGISERKESEFDSQSNAFVKEYLSQNLNYRFGTEELKQINIDLSHENIKEHHFSAHIKKYDESRYKMLSNIKKNGTELNYFDNSYLDKLKNAKDDFFQDLSEFRKITAERSTAKKQIDEETSDELMQIVKDDYRNNILEAYEAIDKAIKDKWKDNAQSLRSILIDVIQGSEALSNKQRKELSEIIINYQPISFEDDIDNVFVKEKFLKIRLFGDDEKLNIRKLANRYNSKIEKAIKNMANDMNKSCFDSFKKWKDKLSSIIESNITEYNPNLRELSDLIREETDRITELNNDKSTIHKSLEAIEDLMNWKEIE